MMLQLSNIIYIGEAPTIVIREQNVNKLNFNVIFFKFNVTFNFIMKDLRR